jgi:phosphoglucomutase
MEVNKYAGKIASQQMLVKIPQLISAYYTETPDPSLPEQQILFGTSGHRGSSLKNSFNENHIQAITQAICLYRTSHDISGPMYIGLDTHALSYPAFITALEVLAANGVEVMIAGKEEYTPTPVISHAIITHNLKKKRGLADGIVITPSHNPPDDGGFKYNPPNGGAAESSVTKWIEAKANEILEGNLKNVKRFTFEKALKSATTHKHDFLNTYINDLSGVVDMDVIHKSKIRLGVDPLGGAGVNYWGPIADKYKLDLTVVNSEVDPTFRFMTVDWDGKIRMDPSSPYAMRGLIGLKEKFDIAFACDTDHDRHGIVTKSKGLLPPNHFLSVAIHFLFKNRMNWDKGMSVGKTLVSSQMIDRVAAQLGRSLYEVPVGFKWFAEGLFNGSLGFVGEESAGASFLRTDGTVWTTDKDGIILSLLSAEITAKTGKDPGLIYQDLTEELGDPVYTRIDAPATIKQKEALGKLSPHDLSLAYLAGDKVTSVLTKAPGNNASIGGLKVSTDNGWFAARPSGTENIYKIYAESFKGDDHLKKIIDEAQSIVMNSVGK